MTTDDEPGVEDATAAVEAPTRLAFISHKHTDKDIADRVATFLKKLSGGNISTFVSSAVQTDGARFGGDLDDELKRNLANSGLVILVYTDPADNWEYCLWECGVATDPTDQTPTRVEVFSLGGSVPAPYQTKLTVRIATAAGVADEESRTSLRNFARQFCRHEDFWPDDGGPISPGYDDETIDEFVDGFLADAAELVRQPDDLLREMTELVTGMSREVSDRLIPVVRRARAALEWGTIPGPSQPLFDDYWDGAYVQDLAKVADRKLVFRPPVTRRFWERLLDTVLAVETADDEGPLVRLVSGEDRQNPLEFWLQAMNDRSAHSRDYEGAVRSVAEELRDKHGSNQVERRFLVPADFFADDEHGTARIERLNEIAQSMSTGQITVSVGRLGDAPDYRWRDYAVVGRTAVSRFESVDNLWNRVLIEDFDPDEVTRAIGHWNNSTPAIWTHDIDIELEQFLEAKNMRL